MMHDQILLTRVMYLILRSGLYTLSSYTLTVYDLLTHWLSQSSASAYLYAPSTWLDMVDFVEIHYPAA